MPKNSVLTEARRLYAYKLRPDGYTRSTRDGLRKLNHVWVWEKHRGPVPVGHHIHHKNGNRADNRISNLEAIRPLDHKRRHAGCYKNKKGKWVKPCPHCGKHLSLTRDFYGRGNSPGLVPNHVCKVCAVLKGLLFRNRKKLKTAKAQIKILSKKLEARRGR